MVMVDCQEMALEWEEQFGDQRKHEVGFWKSH